MLICNLLKVVLYGHTYNFGANYCLMSYDASLIEISCLTGTVMVERHGPT